MIYNLNVYSVWTETSKLVNYESSQYYITRLQGLCNLIYICVFGKVACLKEILSLQSVVDV